MLKNGGDVKCWFLILFRLDSITQRINYFGCCRRCVVVIQVLLVVELCCLMTTTSVRVIVK